uniref:Uncharacterized protein n=1 Tax=Knipowitschia caucasica TaxID=637954 RepID=A0AAV2MN12_KNICA
MKDWNLYTSEDDERLYTEAFDLEALLAPTPPGGVQEPATADTMKDWNLYTSEDDERLYSEAFDLDALLAPTPPGGVQEPELQDILLESIIQPPTPLEESAVVRALREQLQEAWAEISSQAEVNKAQELKLQTQQQRADNSAAELLEAKRKLQTTESSFRELTKDFGDIRYLYNKAVSDKASQGQELVFAKHLIASLKKSIQDQAKAIQELQLNSARERHVSRAMDTEGLSQRDMSSQTSPEDFVSELQQLKQQLRATQLKLQQEAKDFGEMRILYNSAVCDKVTLRQELTSELMEAKRKLRATESSFRELTKDFGDIRYLYNQAVSDKANQGQELVSAKRLIASQKKSIQDQAKAIQELQLNSASSRAMDTEGLSQRDMSSQTSPEDFVSELQQLKQQLRATQLKLQQEAKDFGEMRILYNSAVCDKVTLRQELRPQRPAGVGDQRGVSRRRQ